ncbi:hypothetical protein DL93DRAFT_1367878 [Clavulina sp. PMI_390]|nr:hypothetical protein DL93DRAFT_1367878 [Clavulina sp. PMI_390]
MTVKPPTLSNTETHTKISVAHLNSYLRRERQKSQQQLMKISATVFGWEPNPPKEKADLPTEVQPEPINDSTQGLKFSQPLESPKSSDWSNQAEWLHRSAHSYGTLSFNDPAEQYGPQEKANIIFGTKEANTFMMRPEASVKNIARMQSYRISDAIEGAKFGPAAFSASSSGYRMRGPFEFG